MTTNNKTIGFDHTAHFMVYNKDLCSKNPISDTAAYYMELVGEEVSSELFDVLKKTLAGFNEDMQIEIADNLLNFIDFKAIVTTGCYSVDLVLNMCYLMIAEEQGLISGNVKQQFITLCNGE